MFCSLKLASSRFTRTFLCAYACVVRVNEPRIWGRANTGSSQAIHPNFTRRGAKRYLSFSLAEFFVNSVGVNKVTLWAVEAGYYVGIDDLGNIVTSVSTIIFRNRTKQRNLIFTNILLFIVSCIWLKIAKEHKTVHYIILVFSLTVRHSSCFGVF